MEKFWSKNLFSKLAKSISCWQPTWLGTLVNIERGPLTMTWVMPHNAWQQLVLLIDYYKFSQISSQKICEKSMPHINRQSSWIQSPQTWNLQNFEWNTSTVRVCLGLETSANWHHAMKWDYPASFINSCTKHTKIVKQSPVNIFFTGNPPSQTALTWKAPNRKPDNYIWCIPNY